MTTTASTSPAYKTPTTPSTPHKWRNRDPDTADQIRHTIRNAGPAGVTHHDLRRCCRRCPTTVLDRLIRQVLASGEFEHQVDWTTGRVRHRYRVAEEQQ